MAKVKLIALRKMMYNTRHLQAGDRFEARAVDAVVLTDLRKSARVDYEAPVVTQAAAQQPPPPPQPPQSEEVASALALADLRAAAEGLGIRIDRRWAEGRLRQEIENARFAQTQPAAASEEPAAAPGGDPEPSAPEPTIEQPPAPSTEDEHASPAMTTSSAGGLFGLRR